MTKVYRFYCLNFKLSVLKLRLILIFWCHRFGRARQSEIQWFMIFTLDSATNPEFSPEWCRKTPTKKWSSILVQTQPPWLVRIARAFFRNAKWGVRLEESWWGHCSVVFACDIPIFERYCEGRTWLQTQLRGFGRGFHIFVQRDRIVDVGWIDPFGELPLGSEVTKIFQIEFLSVNSLNYSVHHDRSPHILITGIFTPVFQKDICHSKTRHWRGLRFWKWVAISAQSGCCAPFMRSVRSSCSVNLCWTPVTE
jgi:hypothetical protein